MRNNLWVGSGISKMGEIPMLGMREKGLAGLIKSMFKSGAQGFAYDPNDLTEEKIKWRKNLLNYSNDLTKSGWNFVAASAAIETITTPDGLAAASKLIELASTNQHSCTNILAVNKEVGSDYTLSFYAKAGERKVLGVGNSNFADAGSAWQSAVFDLEKGTIENEFGGLTPTITSVGGGWYKITVKFKVLGASLNSIFRMWLSDGVYTQTPSYTGDGTSGLYVYKFQLEKGTNATAYQPITDFNTEFLKAFPNHALHQDAAGTIPVTAAGQPVGLMLDKSKLTEQTVVKDVKFADGLGGFNISPTLEPTHTIKLVNGLLDIRLDTPTPVVSFSLPNVGAVGDWVHITVDCAEYTSGSLKVDGLGVALVSKAGLNSGIFQLISTSLSIYRQGTPTLMKLRGIKVVKLTGNHAYQTVSASRPILQQTPILGNELLPVVGSFDAGNTGWSAPNGGWTYTAGAAVSTGGVIGLRYIMPTPAVTSVGKTYTISMVIRSKGTQGSIAVSFSDGSIFTKRWELKDIVNGSVLSQSGTVTVNTHIYVVTNDGWDGSIESVSIKEVTGYRTDQNYLAFDGVDDFLQTSNIDFTATDKVSLFAGVRKLSDITSGAVVELSANTASNNGSFGLFAPDAPTRKDVTSFLKGNGNRGSLWTGNYSAPVSVLVTAKFDISASNNQYLKVNSAVYTSAVSVGSGSFGNYPLYIGRRGGTQYPFSGNIYSLIIVGRLTTDNETKRIESEIAKLTGVTLNV